MPIIASRNLVAMDVGRDQFPVRLAIGLPYRCAENDWACAIELDGLYKHLWDQHGVDSFQALMMAQHLAKSLLTEFIKEGGQLFDVPAGVPLNVEKLFLTGEAT
ncbi:MAG: hypothetical protein ABIT36_06615 [Steroidobacteraceae bacterium]